ncbi:MAG TPA: AAA family ATPase [Candidatus Acidoferrales bacterium]|nr:AAA family ATPase [Candidatus Acidoferrales bacterium]
MNCQGCGHQNRDAARFCEACGGPLSSACASCGTALRPAARFCDNCGTPAAEPKAPRSDDAERRPVTVLFADLVDSTALAERVDPEEFRELVQAYHRLCTDEIERFGGHVSQYLGDGVLAYFGYPVALENDAQGAVRAGLAIVRAMASRRESIELAARVGIHTGVVVTDESDPSGARQLSVGGTLNIAARLQSLAKPNAVVVSDATQRLVQGFFESWDLGLQTIKGLSTPVRVYEMRAETDAQNRIEAALSVGLTPLIGRDDEVGILIERWQRATTGAGQLALVSGEAGIGKSRLLQELKERAADGPSARLECHCAPHREHSALYPVIDLLDRLWQLKRIDSVEEKLARLEEAVADYGSAVPDVVPLLASLLSLPIPDRYPALDLTPQRRRRKTLDALVTILLEMAAQQPLLFAVEDLHWIDPSSLDLLNLLLPHVPHSRILVVLLFRPTFQPPWALDDHTTAISLSRLPPELTTAMIELVAGGRRLPHPVLRDLCDKADGVPLYIEELTKMILESGLLRSGREGYELSGRLPSSAIPVTLQESLIARLDRLAPVKEVVQLGAVIGRAFSYELLRAVWRRDEETLQRELARLVEAEVLYSRGKPPATTYLFKHALIQDAAYESLVKNKRREYHQRIAQVFEERFAEIVETQPELLAHHWEGAGRTREAITYYHRAGQRAIERSANLEAASHLGTALELVAALPAGADQARLELELRVTLGPALLAIKGYSVPEVEQVYARARTLCDEVGETSKLFYDALTGLFLFHQARGELRTALDLTRKRLHLAEQLGDRALVMQVHENLGTVGLWQGDFEEALSRLNEALSHYDPERARSIALVYGTDSAVVCDAYAAWALWFLGYPDRARRRAEESVARARAIRHANSLGICLGFAAALHQVLRDAAATQRLADECIAVSAEHQLPLWHTMGTMFRGWALAAQGRGDEGIAEMYEGVTGYQGMGMGLGARFMVALLAQAYLNAGKCDDGLGVLNGGLAVVGESEDRFCDAEIQRVKGEFLLGTTPPDPVAAESCFVEALDLARRHHARSLELRAARSLARLWAGNGQRAQARALLAGVHGWFTEGFGTPDLQEASALLASLSDERSAAAAG